MMLALMYGTIPARPSTSCLQVVVISAQTQCKLSILNQQPLPVHANRIPSVVAQGARGEQAGIASM